MKGLGVLIFLSALAYSTALVNNISQCSTVAKPIDKLNEKVKIGACKKPPCRLRKNTSIAVEIKFKPEKEITKLTNSINANILSIPFPFIGYDQTDACTNIWSADGTTKESCPLKAGQDYTYKNNIDVLSIYPRVKIVVHWGLTTDDGDITCFEVPARITN